MKAKKYTLNLHHKSYKQRVKDLFNEMRLIDKSFDDKSMKDLKSKLHTLGKYSRSTINSYLNGGNNEITAQRIFEWCENYVKSPLFHNKNIKD